MAINIDNIWNSVKKNAGNAKNIAELRIKLSKANNELSDLYRSLGCLCYQHCAEEQADVEAKEREEARHRRTSQEHIAEAERYCFYKAGAEPH